MAERVDPSEATAPGRRAPRRPARRAGPAVALALLLLATLAPSRAAAQDPPAAAGPTQPEKDDGKPDFGDQPALFQADTVTYDRERQIVTATGNVEIFREGRTVLADAISYNQKTDVVTATGNVRLIEITGEVLFGSYVELTGNLKDGFIRDVGVLMTDDSRLVARDGRRIGGQRKEMRRAIFSPCNLCPDDPDAAPLWQIKAAKVIHDEAAKDIAYEDARMEIFGVPIFYTPYFEHPDPTVKRRSGFLTPTIGRSSDLGFILGVPYFFEISPSMDITLEPQVLTNEGWLLAGEYRQRLTHGEIGLGGSAAYVDQFENGVETGEKTFRGHVRGFLRYDIDENWRSGLTIDRASDRTYLRRFRFGDRNVLESNAFTEGFFGRDYAALQSYVFQDLRPEDSDLATPYVLPLLTYNHVSRPDSAGRFWGVDAMVRAIGRQDDDLADQAISLRGRYVWPITTAAGEIIRLTASLATDGYHVNHLEDPDGSGATLDGLSGRVFPQFVADYRYPWVRRSGSVSQIIEPRVSIVLSPNGGNPGMIPNEDSQGFEFDETNLFGGQRFSGIDLVSGGQRVNYGLTLGVYGDGGGSSELFIGQSYQLHTDDTYPAGTGLDDNLSDIVGRLRISPSRWLDLLYRFRLDKDDLAIRRTEFGFNAGPSWLRVSGQYLNITPESDTSTFGRREQLAFAASSRLTDHWSLGGRLVRDLEEKRFREIGATLNYGDECIVVSLDYKRSFFEDDDLQPDDSVFLRVTFKYLGTVEARTGLSFGGTEQN